MTTSGSTPTEASSSDSTPQPSKLVPPDPSIRVWDWPVRLTHWCFPILIACSWLSAENSAWAWHKRFGLILLGLLVFRIAWGFLGTRTARFSQFVRGPSAILAYLKGGAKAVGHTIGHSPLAALSVIALLGAMLFQVSLGLFAGDPYDGLTGPLNPLVGVMTADSITDIHETFVYAIGALIALHLTAIAYYGAVKQDDLVSPMLSGRKIVDEGIEGIGPTPFMRFVIAAGLAAALTAWIAFGAPPLT